MKNQYFGDRRDLFKYDLLADLAGCLPGSRLVFIPMLTPDDDSGEGRLTVYARGERRGRLVDALREAVASGTRNIQLLRTLMPMVGVQFMPYQDGEYFSEARRADYFAAVPTDWLAGSVIFFDPDIGLETGSAAYMRRNGIEKYLFYADLKTVRARASDDSVFVVYQHLQNDATKRTANLQRRLVDMTSHLDIASAWAVQWGDLAFLVAVCEGSVAAKIGRTLNEHVQRHGGMLSEVAGEQSRPIVSPVVGVSDSCLIGRLASGDMAHVPKMTNIGLDDVVGYLNAAQIRATYGAVARVVGGIAQSIGARLGGVAGQRPEASWVVNAATGLPTGYLPDQRHPALLRNGDIIRSPDDLRRRVAEWKVAGASSRPTEVGIPNVDSAPVFQERPRSESPQPPMPVKPLSVDDLADLRRKLTVLLNTLDVPRGGQTEGIRKRINRLSYDGGPIPRHVAALMVTITEMRNSAEYHSKVLSPAECAVVRHAWQAIQEWAQAVRRL